MWPFIRVPAQVYIHADGSVSGQHIPLDPARTVLPSAPHSPRLTFMLVVLPVGSSTPVSLSTQRTVTISAPCVTGQQLCGTPPSCSQVRGRGAIPMEQCLT